MEIIAQAVAATFAEVQAAGGQHAAWQGTRINTTAFSDVRKLGRGSDNYADRASPQLHRTFDVADTMQEDIDTPTAVELDADRMEPPGLTQHSADIFQSLAFKTEGEAMNVGMTEALPALPSQDICEGCARLLRSPVCAEARAQGRGGRHVSLVGGPVQETRDAVGSNARHPPVAALVEIMPPECKGVVFMTCWKADQEHQASKQKISGWLAKKASGLRPLFPKEGARLACVWEPGSAGGEAVVPTANTRLPSRGARVMRSIAARY